MMIAAVVAALISAADAGVREEEPLLQWVRGTEPVADQHTFHSPSEYFRYQRAHCSRKILGEAGARAAAAEALKILKGGAAEEVKARAAALLGWMQRAEAISTLGAVATSAQAEVKVRVAAIDALRFFGRTVAWETTIGGGGRPASEVFELRPDAKATDALILIAQRKDLSTEEADALIIAAIHHRSPKLIEAITRIRGVDERNANALFRLYRSWPSPQSTTGLSRLLRAPGEHLPYAAEEAGKSHSPEVVAPLLFQLGNPSKTVRRAAFEALSRLSGDSGVADDQQLMKDPAEMRQRFTQKLGPNGEKVKRSPAAHADPDDAAEPSSCSEE